MNLDELKAMIEAEALRRQAARDGLTLDALKGFLGDAYELPPHLRAAAPPPPERLSFAYFDGLDGHVLVASCYAVLLGREPDPSGMQHYVELLERGEEKAFIVGAIALSPEARKRGVRVAGLWPRFAVAAGRRVPVAGALFAWLVALLMLGRREREARAFGQKLHARLDSVLEYVAKSQAQVTMRIEALRSVLEARD